MGSSNIKGLIRSTTVLNPIFQGSGVLIKPDRQRLKVVNLTTTAEPKASEKLWYKNEKVLGAIATTGALIATFAAYKLMSSGAAPLPPKPSFNPNTQSRPDAAPIWNTFTSLQDQAEQCQTNPLHVADLQEFRSLANVHIPSLNGTLAQDCSQVHRIQFSDLFDPSTGQAKAQVQIVSEPVTTPVQPPVQPPVDTTAQPPVPSAPQFARVSQAEIKAASSAADHKKLRDRFRTNIQALSNAQEQKTKSNQATLASQG